MKAARISTCATGVRFAYLGDYTVREGRDGDAAIYKDLAGDDVLVAVCQAIDHLSAFDVALRHVETIVYEQQVAAARREIIRYERAERREMRRQA